MFGSGSPGKGDPEGGELEVMPNLPTKDCTGCAACANQCPFDCISMKPDKKGFLYPAIDEARCTRCGLCESTCPILQPGQQFREEFSPVCYAAWSRDHEVRFNSTSGGIFTHLAQAVLAQDGYVVGARYRGDHLVEHIIISTLEQLSSLRQSKYVQSEIGLVYREIQAHLERDKPVLFAGTPCQCAGLRSFLGKEYERLYLCDFICRGVNSPSVYLSYLQKLEKEYGSPIRQIWFKNKTFGWNNFATKITFQNGEEYLADRETDPYMLSYIKSKQSKDMRPSCYACHFKGIQRPVDITLGDFWGVEKQFPDIDTKNGVSVVIIQSLKGKELFALASKDCVAYPADLERVSEGNVCLLKSVCEVEGND